MNEYFNSPDHDFSHFDVSKSYNPLLFSYWFQFLSLQYEITLYQVPYDFMGLTEAGGCTEFPNSTRTLKTDYQNEVKLQIVYTSVIRSYTNKIMIVICDK
jgi:hypothetical protein